MTVRGLIQHPRARMLRFVLVGGAGFVLYLLFAQGLRLATPLSTGWAAWLATLLAIAPTFVLQRRFTFRSSGSFAREFASYTALQLVNAGVIGLSARWGSRLLGLPDFPVFVLAGAIGVLVSYVVQSLLVFNVGEQDSGP